MGLFSSFYVIWYEEYILKKEGTSNQTNSFKLYSKITGSYQIVGATFLGGDLVNCSNQCPQMHSRARLTTYPISQSCTFLGWNWMFDWEIHSKTRSGKCHILNVTAYLFQNVFKSRTCHQTLPTITNEHNMNKYHPTISTHSLAL